jgi:hypothetical protein
MFAFRILVDIALKALSAAINDPTTAVLAIDQLHRLLRMVGKRSLTLEEIVDRSGQVRVAIENLIQTLPTYRHDALRAELTLLDLAIASKHLFPEDVALARIPDSQGLGGSAASRADN